MTLFPEENSGLCEQTLNETIEGLSLLLEEMKIKNISQDFFRTVVVPLSVYFYSLEKREQPYFICFTGGQGSGKTTLSEFVQFVLKKGLKQKTIGFSIDDIYKTKVFQETIQRLLV